MVAYIYVYIHLYMLYNNTCSVYIIYTYSNICIATTRLHVYSTPLTISVIDVLHAYICYTYMYVYNQLYIQPCCLYISRLNANGSQLTII